MVPAADDGIPAAWLKPGWFIGDPALAGTDALALAEYNLKVVDPALDVTTLDMAPIRFVYIEAASFDSLDPAWLRQQYRQGRVLVGVNLQISRLLAIAQQAEGPDDWHTSAPDDLEFSMVYRRAPGNVFNGALMFFAESIDRLIELVQAQYDANDR